MPDDQIAIIAQEVAARVLGVMSTATIPKVWLNTDETATYCGISRDHLGKLRERGTGPNYRKFGKSVIYNIAELDEFMKGLPQQVCRRRAQKGA